MLMPSHAKNVKPYKEPEPLFIRFQVERQLDGDVLAARGAAIGRLHRHQPDRGAGLDRRQLRQGDARAQYRGHRAQDQSRGRRGDRPAAAPARPRRPDRHRLHRHGGAAQQPAGRAAAQGGAAQRPRAHPGRAHQPFRPAGDVAPAPAHRHARRLDQACPIARAPAWCAPSSRSRSTSCAPSRTG